MKYKRKCWKCGVTSEDPGAALYRFPRPGVTNMLRCELWAKYMFPNGAWASQEFQKKLYSEHRMLCHKHFKRTSFIDVTQKKLHRHAAPDMECDENTVVQTDFTSAAGPSHAVLIDITNTRPHDSDTVPGLMQSDYASDPGPSHAIEMDITETRPHDVTKGSNTAPVSGLAQQEYANAPGSSHTVVMDIINTRPHDSDAAPAPELIQQCARQNLQSGKDRHSYIQCRKHMKKVCQLRNTIKKMKKKYSLRILVEDDAVKKLQKKISPTFALLLQGQIKNFKKKPKGRRWSAEDKSIALRLYKRSPTCYRLLRRMFCLPAPSSLKKLLSRFNMPPGINVNVLETLKKRTQTQKPSDNEYILMFDEMSIKKHLQYNKKSDKIEGFQDHGNHGRTQQEAVKALVFMIAGIRKPVKQPLAYYLSGANVTADRLAVLLKETLRECFNAKLQVSATVCDMGGTNRRALVLLGATEEHPRLKIDDRDVIALFDAPHLLKCFRNMFMKYNIKCKTDISSSDQCGEGLAKWSDIKDFYEDDSKNPNFVYAPSLKREHLDPNAKQKMKVNLAAQVLSHTVACGMFAKVSEGKLPAGAVVTANVISKMDKLFDLVNSDSPDRRRGKPYATNMSSTSPHLKVFKEMKDFFKSLQFVGCPRTPPSIEGWTWTINAIQLVWSKMKKYPNVQSIATRRLQQDPLENLFGCIRANCGSNDNPTTGAFIGGLKTAVISNLAHISSGNCEIDNNLAIIENFKTLLSPSAPTCEREITQGIRPLQSSTDSILRLNFEEIILGDSGEMQACAYVCGFLIKNHKLLNKCLQCKQIFKTEKVNNLHNFVENKEYSDVKKCLNYATNALVECVEKCALITNRILAQDAYKSNIKQLIENEICDGNLFNLLKTCPNHYEVNKKYIKNSVFYICVNRFCTLKNRSYAEEASRSALKKKIDILQHR